MIQIVLVVMAINIQPEYYTNTNYIYDMTGFNNIIYCATNGGFIAFNKQTNDFVALTNTDGLQKNAQNSVSLDSSGHVWVGNDLGLALVESDFSGIHIYPVECLTCTRTQGIVCLKDSIYVGSSNGLLFIDTKGTPIDFDDDTQIKLFDLPCNDIRSIAIDDTSIWVGTATGGILNFSKDMALDTVYTTDHGLLSNQINDLMLLEGELYVATNSGLNHFAADHFDTLLTGFQINVLSYLGDSLILGLNEEQQVGVFYGGAVTIANSGLPGQSKVLSLLNLDGELHCGLGNRFTKDYFGDGIGTYNASGNVWALTKNRCLPSNHISEITSNEHGVFVACGNRAEESRGAGWLNNQDQWVNFSADSILPSNYVHRCTTTPDGRVWFAYNHFPDNSSSIMVSRLDPVQNDWYSLPNRYNGMEGCVAIWDIEFDRDQNMYLALAGPANRLWLIDSALNTVYHLNPQLSGFKVEIAIDSSGKVWRSLTDAGLLMTDTKNTLFDRADDEYRNYTTTDGLISNYIRGCLVDKNNSLYAASDEGLIIYDGIQFTNRTDISDSELLDVELDSQSRIWILARDGIYCLDPVSDIVRDWRFADCGIEISFMQSIGEMIQVQGFNFDANRNCFWTGGENGLLKLTIQYDSIPEIGAATVYPNPVRQNVVRIKDIPSDASVDIYTISGRRVAQDLMPDVAFGEVVWEIPEDIASGLYFALVRSDRGNKTYKFAIIR